jgi:anti-anti-sigma regulatory factor
MTMVDTPAKPVGVMELGDHLALLYDNDEERRSVMAAYARDGVRAGHKIVYISDGVTAAEVLAWLLAEGAATGPGPQEETPDLSEAMDAGHFIVRTAEETFLASGRFDPAESIELIATEIDLARVQGYRGVRITGEARFSLRRWPGTERFGEFEQLLDDAFLTSDPTAMAVCQFDRRWFDDARLAEVETRHMGRVRVNDYHDDGSLRITPIFNPPGAELAGTIDGSNLAAAEDVLASITTRTGLLCLDLSGLTGCDAAGLRLLTGAFGPGRRRGHGLLLRGVPPALHDRFREEGLDGTPGIAVEYRPR